jgi:large subunit ribosomal protein L6
MSMTIPPFVKLEHDAAARKAYVTVEDREVKKQREMWGMLSTMGFHIPY